MHTHKFIMGGDLCQACLLGIAPNVIKRTRFIPGDSVEDVNRIPTKYLI